MRNRHRKCGEKLDGVCVTASQLSKGSGTAYVLVAVLLSVAIIMAVFEMAIEKRVVQTAPAPSSAIVPLKSENVSATATAATDLSLLAAEVASDIAPSEADRPAPKTGFASSALEAAWLADMSSRLEKKIPGPRGRLALLRTVHYEATRSGLDPQLVLAIIDRASQFRKFEISSNGGAGFMQVATSWREKIGRESDNLINLRTNIRYGCVILRHYLDESNGDLSKALQKYDASRLGPKVFAHHSRFPEDVITSLRSGWHYETAAPVGDR